MNLWEGPVPQQLVYARYQVKQELTAEIERTKKEVLRQVCQNITRQKQAAEAKAKAAAEAKAKAEAEAKAKAAAEAKAKAAAELKAKAALAEAERLKEEQRMDKLQQQALAHATNKLQEHISCLEDNNNTSDSAKMNRLEVC